ncbi:GntR family transcriptional regulator [bacterium 3DAC]|nr:GntR family transcriptional regulator [bacterium 3DAC]
MDIKIDYHNTKPVYKQIKEQIKYAIATGELKPDYRLPPIRTLASQLQVNPGTIQRVYRELLSEGYLYTKGSGGTYISREAPVILAHERQQIITEDIKTCVSKAKKLGLDIHTIHKLIDKEWNNDA